MGEDFVKYSKILRKRFWIIMLLPAIALLTAAYLNIYILKPVYESSVSIIIINKAPNPNAAGYVTYDDLMISQQLVKDYKEILISRSVTSQTINSLGIKDLAPSVLSTRISAESKNNTDIIMIDVKDGDPRRAKLIIDRLVEVFQEKIFTLFENRNVRIIDPSNLADRPSSPKVIPNIVLATFAGFLIALILIFLLEIFDVSIKTVEEAEEKIGLPVLGIIPDLKIK